MMVHLTVVVMIILNVIVMVAIVGAVGLTSRPAAGQPVQLAAIDTANRRVVLGRPSRRHAALGAGHAASQGGTSG